MLPFFNKIINVRKLKSSFLEAFLNFVGRAECQWQDYDKRHSKKDLVAFNGSEKCLNAYFELITNEEGQWQTILIVIFNVNFFLDLPPGKHCFNYIVKLPPNIPSSTVEPEGQIKYHAHVVFIREYKHNLVFNFDVTVIQPTDLNLTPILEVPNEQEKIKRFGCWCCATKPISFSVILPISGYVVGQTVTLNVIIHNPSNIEVTKVNTYFIKTVRYRSETPFQKSKEATEILVKKSSEINCKKSKQEFDIQFRVPEVPQSIDLDTINIKYAIKVKAKIRGHYGDPHFQFPVVIGAIPIKYYEGDLESSFNLFTYVPTNLPQYQPNYVLPYGNVGDSGSELQENQIEDFMAPHPSLNSRGMYQYSRGMIAPNEFECEYQNV